MTAAHARKLLRIWACAPKLVREKEEEIRINLEMMRSAYSDPGSCVLVDMPKPKRRHIGDRVAYAMCAAGAYAARAKAARDEIVRIVHTAKLVSECVRPERGIQRALLMRYRSRATWVVVASACGVDASVLREADRRVCGRIVRRVTERSGSTQPVVG